MQQPKTQPTKDSVEAFIDGVENEKRRQDSRVVLKMMSDITGVEPIMWGTAIVGFGSYTYKYASGREGDWMIIGFSPRKAALTLYGLSYYGSNSDLTEQLGPHTTGKGCIYIKDLDKINKDILEQMIKRGFETKPEYAV